MKPRQHSSWWWAVKWPAGRQGAGRLSPDTRNSLYERIKSGVCSPGQGTKGSDALLWRWPPTHSPSFSPFEPLLAVPPAPCLGERWMVEMGSGQTVLGEPSVLGWDPLELKN